MTKRTIAGLRFNVPSPSVYQLCGFPVQIFFANGSWWIECGGKVGARPSLQAAAEDLAWVLK
jgi:hypothetical protein